MKKLTYIAQNRKKPGFRQNMRGFSVRQPASDQTMRMHNIMALVEVFRRAWTSLCAWFGF